MKLSQNRVVERFSAVRVVSGFALVLLCAPLAAQASFECYAPGRFPLPGPPNCENLLCNNLGLAGTTGITNLPACGMPTQGSQYARVEANGPFNVPQGGPPTYPLPSNVTELRIPIPAGATALSFCWDFYNSEGFGAFLNDGMAVAIVAPSGNMVQLLAYADASSLPGACADFSSFLAIEVAPNGPQGFSGALPALAGGEYVSVACWNGIDNFNPSHAKLDDVKFIAGATSCPVPPPPPPNDDCANAIVVQPGVNGPFSNVNATTGIGAAGCAFGADLAEVWFVFTAACGGVYRIDTCGASFNTVLSVLDGCAGAELACNDDAPPGTCSVPTDSYLEIAATAGTPYYIRVAGSIFFGGVTGSFNLNVAARMTFAFTTGPGFGSVGFDITGGPPGGLYFAAITLNQGNFPLGAFYGVDIGLPELATEFSLGFPFTGGLASCGGASFGPISGAPSGLVLFGTALGFPGPTYGIPSKVAMAPATVVVP
jgi:hypothetical protein